MYYRNKELDTPVKLNFTDRYNLNCQVHFCQLFFFPTSDLLLKDTQSNVVAADFPGPSSAFDSYDLLLKTLEALRFREIAVSVIRNCLKWSTRKKITGKKFWKRSNYKLNLIATSDVKCKKIQFKIIYHHQVSSIIPNKKIRPRWIPRFSQVRWARLNLVEAPISTKARLVSNSTLS